jgi:hypothetical protein
LNQIRHCPTGQSSAEAKEDLYKRGLKALFNFKKSYNLYKPKIKTLLHIFDHTVKPVLLYGSEVKILNKVGLRLSTCRTPMFEVKFSVIVSLSVFTQSSVLLYIFFIKFN